MKKGFTLIELLAVIIILALLMIVAIPNVLNTMNNAKKQTFVTQTQSLWTAAETQWVREQMTGTNSNSYNSETNKLDLSTIGNNVKYSINLNEKGKVTQIVVDDGTYKINATKQEDIKVDNVIESDGDVTPSPSGGNTAYVDSTLNGTDPVLGSGMIPVILTGGTSSWTVTVADTKNEWYNYSESEWANAVILKSSDTTSYKAGETIPNDNIEGYYVWIPKYSYQIFDMGNYSTETAKETRNQIINIEFGTTNTTDILSGDKQSCTTPGTSGTSGNCAVNRWMTHPAFLAFDVTGFWVGKFETTGTSSEITILPLTKPLTSKKVGEIFNLLKYYKPSLTSHMMKNTEWGAVAYLSNSNYGRGNTKMHINNYENGSYNYKTGCVSTTVGAATTKTCENEWYTTGGFNGSTTGNITGIYDMAGGAWEIVAAHTVGYLGVSTLTSSDESGDNAKYFDVYNNCSEYGYKNRILGDATGEMGPFKNLGGSWHGAKAVFITSSYPWFMRGASAGATTIAGPFYFYYDSGGGHNSGGSRIVLAPKN